LSYDNAGKGKLNPPIKKTMVRTFINKRAQRALERSPEANDF